MFSPLRSRWLVGSHPLHGLVLPLLLLFLTAPLVIWAAAPGVTPLALTEVICDNQNTACFSKYESGGVGSWGYVPFGGVGSSGAYSGHAYWTYNSLNSAIDWGMWQPNLPQAGTYDVYVWYPYYPGNFPETNSASYQVHHASGDQFVPWNQASSAGQWNKIATVNCTVGTACYVKLTDATNESTNTRRVWFDAVKFTLTTYTVTGTVRDSSGTGIAGVTVSDGTRNAVTDNTGSYTLSAVPVGNYTLTPTKSGYSFTPTTSNLIVAGNLSGQNFTGTLITYSVSGRIVDSSSNALVGVTVTDGTRTALTDASGIYTLTGVLPGSYTLTPTKIGYSFTPTTSNLTVADNLSGQNFTGTLLTYSVSGRIVDSSSNALVGVTVTDGTRTALTDASGIYTLTGVLPGSYTLTPTKSGYSFTPATRSATVVAGNLPGQDFTATLLETTGGSWTFILYLDGDTAGLDGGFVALFLADAIQRLETNPNALVRVVALIDGPGSSDTRRVTFTPQAQYQVLGEKPMDDPTTLSEFVQQAQRDFPADHYYLAIADHANGVQGIAWDTTTASDRTALLTPAKLRQALSTITNNGARPLDIVHFDGCSFGLFENAAMTRGYARYVVASENIGWGVFAYDRYRAAVGATTTPALLATDIVKQYAQAVGAYPYTISALDMSRFEAALTGLNSFADRLIAFATGSPANSAILTNLRKTSQKFDSGGTPYLTINDEDLYVDLVDFATRTKQQITSDGIPTAADALITAISTGNQPFVLFEKHYSGTFENEGKPYSWALDGAHGVSVYYPPRSAGAMFVAYVTGVTFPEFTALSHWKDYLRVGVPPLLPGESPPNDQPEPLALLLPPSRYTVYLPMLRR